MPLEPGSRLGPYEVQSQLGAGGMGEVYRARDTRLDRTVAIKVLPQANSADERRLERFRQEARAVSRLTHPNICTLHDVGEQDGTFFLVMEHLSGRTLANRLEEGPLPAPELLRLGIQMAEALHAAHREGVVHRDLKPANVMLTREGAKLLDFGLARLRLAEQEPGLPSTVSHLTEEGEVLGTLPYMAPEQLEGRPADPRTDLFALGVVLYEMATGRRPFEGNSRASLIAAILREEPPPLSQRQPVAPPGLEWVVRRCLAKDPEERWQSAADLAAQLRWILETRGQAAPMPAGRRSGGGLAWALAAVLAALALAVTALGARGLLFRHTPPRYQRLTFRVGTLLDARFAHDGETFVYSANWQGEGAQMFLGRLGSAESRPLGIPGARITAVSRGGELAFTIVTNDTVRAVGLLSRVSMTGGAPRPLLEDVRSADWLPGGTELAVVRRKENKEVLEFPLGRPVQESFRIWSVRVSPDGDRVAFFMGPYGGRLDGDLVVVDRSGRVIVTSGGWNEAPALAWSPRGTEIWTGGRRHGGPSALHAVTLSGRERVLAEGAENLVLRDVAGDGRALVELRNTRTGVACLPPGAAEERELGWLGRSQIEDLSADGGFLLTDEGFAGGPASGVYVRRLDGSPAIRMGEGRAEALSPDGKWVLAVVPSADGEWFLLPTGPGSPRKLDRGPVRTMAEADWQADGSAIVLQGRTPEGEGGVYVLDLATGVLRLIGPGILPENAVMADGRSAAVFHQRWVLQPLDGGEPRPVPHLGPDDYPLQFTPDGRFAFVRRGGLATAEIERLEITTGTRTPWKTLRPRDPVGVVSVQPVILQPDGRGYCYSYTRVLSDLYLVEGLR